VRGEGSGLSTEWSGRGECGFAIDGMMEEEEKERRVVSTSDEGVGGSEEEGVSGRECMLVAERTRIGEFWVRKSRGMRVLLNGDCNGVGCLRLGGLRA
jgi:hypothetical protein